MAEVKKKISNWGNFPTIEAKQYVINFRKEAKDLALRLPELLARGNGRSYGDAALNSRVVSTLQLRHFLEFDEDRGIMSCESGVLFSDILDFVVPKGFFLPVTPGTKFITVGGAIAADVHGKNHHVEGCFAEFVNSFNLIVESGEQLHCSREENSELFWQTIGGMGLTGIIVDATFTLKKIENSYIHVESIKAKNLEEIMELFESSINSTYTVAWIDCLQTGKNKGRSILMRGEHANANQLNHRQRSEPLKPSPKKKIRVPINFPGFALNALSVRLFNLLYYHKQRKKTISKIVHFESFFYPLDAILEWNRIYGKNGFIQYQFVIPKGVEVAAMEEILNVIAKSKQGSFLAVLKLFGKNNPKAHNSFPIEGYTLALDFKVNNKLYSLIPILDSIILKYKGRIYRAKDSLSDPRLLDYVTVPNKKFNSVQNRRVNNP